MRVLGIETSCDETAASVMDDGHVLSDVVASQIDEHRPFGGVVPEIASRAHMARIAQVIRRSVEQAGLTLRDLHGVGVTQGPGLVGALLVGLECAKALATSLGVPFVGVNHLKGHLLAARIPDGATPLPEMPYMALLASGGHTGVYLVEDWDRISCLGQTRDDAAGEAYDKVAKLLGLGYPGGPLIDRLAQTPGEEITFPQALRQRDSYEFSFSGLKTAVAQHVASLGRAPTQAEIEIVARSFQRAVVEILVRKAVRAARDKAVSRLVLAGGVAANQGLREHAARECKAYDLELFAPPIHRCTDNGAMIAHIGWLALRNGERSELAIGPKSSWPLSV
ncbi:MAG: tRNA (adenosine(37)-N6)-threonylcarbamoyltransferase complex transferase subunit TsaD [Myxococcota bacterium]|jgi:N6-L-threonylcarbamoyladenine synthase|nr:tRNA (adenosine(37)-N6)-threonylcarbamoyltransferase complex transferase subunit TsaD [Myxococcota bacterium]